MIRAVVPLVERSRCIFSVGIILRCSFSSIAFQIPRVARRQVLSDARDEKWFSLVIIWPNFIEAFVGLGGTSIYATGHHLA